jgi:hypothetical protein
LGNLGEDLLEKYVELKGILEGVGKSREDLKSYYVLLPSLFNETLLD